MEKSLILRSQLLKDRLKSISADLNISEDKAYLYYAYSVLFDTEINDAEIEQDIVDGGDDKQIDIIRIEENTNSATIHLLQIKNSKKFSGGVIVKMRDGLNWIFIKDKEKYTTLKNPDFVAKIGEIRRLVTEYGYNRIDLKIYFINNGDKNRASDDFNKEIKTTIEDYIRDFNNIDFDVFGVNEIIEEEYKRDQSKRKINADIEIFYDVNMRSFMEFGSNEIRSAICTIKGSDLAKLVEKNKETIFEENVRVFLGTRRQVNKDIFETATDPEQSSFFWFYNNGITVTCDEFEVIPRSAVPAFIRIKGIQIVNGCQTSTSLLKAYQEESLEDNVHLLLKVFETKDSQFVDRITLTTNNQNAVKNRDLRSNDIKQRDLEKLVEDRGFYYERKPKQHKNISGENSKKIISNEKMGQAYLAIAMNSPAKAMSGKSKLWSQYYDQVYTSNIELLICSYYIYKWVSERNKKLKKGSTDEYVLAISKYGVFHISCLLSSRYMKSVDITDVDEKKVIEVRNAFIKNKNDIEDQYLKTVKDLKKIVKKLISGDPTKVMSIFKSNQIENEINSTIKKEHSTS
ncbi:MAG: AIPR family protein [Gracilimonas sp.]